MQILLVLLTVLVAYTPAVAAPSGKSAPRLSGRITHSEVLPPLPEALKPGQIYSPGPITQRFSGQRRRFLIPDWLAGLWQRQSGTEVSRAELPGGRVLTPGGHLISRVRDKFGTFSDHQGRIWQVFSPEKSLGSVDHGLTVDYHQVTDYDLVIAGEKSVVVKVRAVHTVVNKATGRVVTSYQDEELNTYRSIGDGQLDTDSSVKVFDLNGKPYLRTRAVSSERRLKRFTLLGPARPPDQGPRPLAAPGKSR